MNPLEIIPTVVPYSLDDIAAAVERYAGVASVLHIDVADGRFAPNMTWVPVPGEALPAGISYEAHLMAIDPLEVGLAFARAGAGRIIAHVESFADLDAARDAFGSWRAAGVSQVGLAALFATPLEILDPLVADCDVVQLMTIDRVGVQGIPYESSSLARIAEFHERHLESMISVDGGVKGSNIADLARSGARRFCVGSAFSAAPDPKALYEFLKTRAESAI